MWRKSLWFISLLALSLAVGACQPAATPPDEEDGGSAGGAAEGAVEEEPDAGEAAAEQQPSPDKGPALTQTHRAEEGGYSFDVPEDWTAVSFFGLSMASESQDAIDQWQQSGRYPDVPVVSVAMGVPADFGGDFGSAEEMAVQLVAQDVVEGDAVTVGDPVSLSVGGLPASAVDFSGTQDPSSQDVAGRLVAILGEGRAGLVIGVAPSGQWDAFSPTFDAIVASIAFFEPNPDAQTSGAPASVDTVEVFMGGDASPPQVTVQAHGQLPNFCTTIGDISQKRDGNTFTITVGTAMDDSPGCADSGPIAFGENIPINVTGLAAGQYTVSVNGVTSSFQIGGNSSAAPQSSACGNGTCSGGETAASCPADCSQTTAAGACGNGIVEAGEQCEPGGSPCPAIVCQGNSECGDEVHGMTGCVSWSVTVDATCTSSCTCVPVVSCDDIPQ